MNKKSITFDHILVHAFYEAVVAFIYGYGVYMLLHKGFSNSMAGLIFSIASICSLILSSVVSNIIDSSKKLNAFEIGIIISLSLGFSYFLNYITKTPNIYAALAFIITVSIHCCLEPITNSLSFLFSRKGVDMKYGVARSMGSLSYAIACAGFGVIADKYNYPMLLIIAGCFILANAYELLLLNNNYKAIPATNNSIEQVEKVSLKEFVKNNKSYVIIAIALVGIFFCTNGIESFLTVILENVGGNSKDLGYCLFFKAILEIPGIFFFDKLNKKFDILTLFKFACFWYPIKMLLTLLATSTTLIYVSQIFHSIPFSLINPCMITLANNTMSKKELTRGVSLLSLAITTGTIISSFVCGSIIDFISIKAMILVCLIVCTISCVCLYIAITKFNKTK